MNSRNLVPAKHVAQQRRARAIQRWALINGAYLAVLLVAGIAYAVANLAGNSPDSAQDGPDRPKNLTPTLVALRQKSSRLQADLLGVTGVEDRPDWSLLLNPVAAAMGDNIVLSAIRFAGASPETSGAASGVKPNTLHLSGMGRSYPDVTDFVLRLEQLHYFGRVQLLQTSPTALHAHDSVGFEIDCALPGAAEGH